MDVCERLNVVTPHSYKINQHMHLCNI